MMAVRTTAVRYDSTGKVPVEFVLCHAYKPWSSTQTHEGVVQAACLRCKAYGQCEWTFGDKRGQ